MHRGLQPLENRLLRRCIQREIAILVGTRQRPGRKVRVGIFNVEDNHFTLPVSVCNTRQARQSKKPRNPESLIHQERARESGLGVGRLRRCPFIVMHVSVKLVRLGTKLGGRLAG